MAHNEMEKLMYDRAVSTTRTHGILSIIFGALGILFGLLLVALFVLASVFAETTEDAITSGATTVFIVVLFILPHVYLIISGAYLLRNPNPRMARGLTIANLVVGAFSNLVILVIAIIHLVQLGDYERGFEHHAQKHAK